MNNKKEVLNYCPNYYNIVNFDFTEEDNISDKIVKLYKQYIFNTNIENEINRNRIQELDRILNIYIEDYDFRNTLQHEIIKVRLKKDNNILTNLIESIIKIFSNYEEYTTKKIYIARWI